MTHGAVPPAAAGTARTSSSSHRPDFCAPEARPYILVAAILASSLGFIDGTLVSIALPAMRDGLQASLAQAQWINNGYLLPLSALILLGGAIGDRFGLARSFAAGIAIFVVASLACALAPTAEFLIAARVLKGIGAAVMIPGSLALIARAYPEAERGRAIGIWAAASALTTSIGPILGGLALTYGGPEIWRWLFAINLPLGGLAFWLITAKVNADAAHPDHPVDLPGAALITGGLGLIAVGLTAASEGHGTVRPELALTGICLIIAFLVWEARSAHPMVPLSLFRNRAFSAANAATALIYFALSAIMFFLPMTLVAGWGLEEIWVTVILSPMMIFIPLLSGPAGRLSDKFGPGLLIGAGGLCVAIAFAGLAIATPIRALWFGLLPSTILLGIGMGLVVAPLSTAIMTSVPGERSGTASGINNAVSRVAGLIAVAALGTLAGVIYGSSGGTESFGAFSDADGHGAAMDRAFATLAWITSGLTAVGAAIAWVFISKPMRAA